MKHTPLIFVLYDGIGNSVFEGQVLKPLLQKLDKDANQKIYVISFESKFPKDLIASLPKHERLNLIITKKIPFIGKPTIKYATYQLRKILKNFCSYQLIARGPLAGLICWQSLDDKKCSSFTLQARGLLAEEYNYTTRSEKLFLKKYVHKIRELQFKSLESKAYQHLKVNVNFTIETVSPALKEYLFNTYQINPSLISIAHEDIPTIIPADQLAIWRTEMRNKLHIPHDAKVYCYNGSMKSWQCPELIISNFKKCLSEHENKAFLLILTHDVKQFSDLLHASGIEPKSYQIHQVMHADIYRYLSACDVGFLYREMHIMNWISRPTKALEYHASGLHIEHNNTIAWLNQLK